MLKEVDWDNKLKDFRVSETWDIITELINKAIDTGIPRFSQQSKKKHTYLNQRVLKLRYEKEAAWKKYRVTGNQLDYFRFTQKYNLLRSLTRSLQLNFENQLAKNVKTNPKCLWNYVNSKIKVKTGVATLMSSNGEKATTPF